VLSAEPLAAQRFGTGAGCGRPRTTGSDGAGLGHAPPPAEGPPELPEPGRENRARRVRRPGLPARGTFAHLGPAGGGRRHGSGCVEIADGTMEAAKLRPHKPRLRRVSPRPLSWPPLAEPDWPGRAEAVLTSLFSGIREQREDRFHVRCMASGCDWLIGNGAVGQMRAASVDRCATLCALCEGPDRADP